MVAVFGSILYRFDVMSICSTVTNAANRPQLLYGGIRDAPPRTCDATWPFLSRDMPDDGRSDDYPVVRSHSAPLVFPSAQRLGCVGWAVSVFELADRSGRVQSRSDRIADPMGRVPLPAMLPSGCTSAQMVSCVLGVAAGDAGGWILRNKLRRGLFQLRITLGCVSKIWSQRLACYGLPFEAQARIALCLCA